MKRDSRLGDVSGGESAPGEKTVGEFSLSSLKLKLFLLSDSAPVGRRQAPPTSRILRWRSKVGASFGWCDSVDSPGPMSGTGDQRSPAFY